MVKEDALSSVYTDTHTQIEYYSVIRKNKMMPLAAMQMNLEIIILSEVRQRKTNIVSLMASLLAQIRICPQCGRPEFDLWVGKFPCRREWQPTPVFSPEQFHGHRSLAG